MVLGLYGGGPIEDELRRNSVSPQFFEYGNNILQRLMLQIQLYNFLKRNNVDIVQVHGSYPFTRIIIPAKILRKKIIYTEHAKHSLKQTHRLRLITKFAARFASCVICVSKDLKSYLVKEVNISPKKIQVIHNSIDLKKFDKRTKMLRVVGLAIKSDYIYVGVVGRLTEAKDHSGLFEAWKINIAVNERMLLVLVGDGELKPLLQEKCKELNIEDKVIFLGQRNDIPEIISCMDLLVLPSKREGFPISILEYMAMGKPVIATRVGGVPEIIQHGVNGFLIPPDNPKALAEAIQKFLNNRKFFEQMAINGRKTIVKKFNTNNILTKYEALYEEVFNA